MISRNGSSAGLGRGVGCVCVDLCSQGCPDTQVTRELTKRVAATRSRRAHPTPRPDPAGLRCFPETLSHTRAFVSIADAVEIFGEEEADLGEGLEDGSLAVQE